MDIFGFLSLIGGLALFLYGMHVMGGGLEKLSGGKLERILEKINLKPAESSFAWSRSNRRDTVVVSHYGNASGICQFRHYEAVSGHWDYYGGKYRHYLNLLAFKSDWD